MELGDFLRKCREQLKRTQPDIAAEIEIEQSYLSKIESGKSTPSADVFAKLQHVYNIDIDKLVAVLDSKELSKLADNKTIQAAVSRQQRKQSNVRRQWSIAGLAMLMLGAGCLAVTLIPDRSKEVYIYRSEGVLNHDENLNAFESVYKNETNQMSDQVESSQRADLLKRLDQLDEPSSEYKGEGYVINTLNGRRFFKLIGKKVSTRNYATRWFFVPTLMLLTGGIGCFFMARRLD